MTQTHMILFALTPLIAWRVYKRVGRLTTRQKSRMWRHWFGVIFLPAALLALIVMFGAQPTVLGALLGGAAAGSALGFTALRRMRFEREGGDWFYVPYAPIGMLVAAIFIGRILYRFYEMYTLGAGQAPAFGGSPLTIGILGVVAGYYLVCASGLLRWRLAGARSSAKPAGS